MKYYTAFTVPINPVGATPVITREQAFKALLVKTEKPQAFVPVISESKVTSRHKTGLVRRVWFKPGVGPPNSQDGLEEEVEFIGDLRVDFHLTATGTRIQNIISPGGEGEHDLYLTFGAHFIFPEIEEGTPAAEVKRKELRALNQRTVPMSVATIREMAKKGEI